MTERNEQLLHDLRAAIEQRDLSLHEASAEIGVGVNSLYRWLGGEVQPRARQRRIVRAWLERQQAAA